MMLLAKETCFTSLYSVSPILALEQEVRTLGFNPNLRNYLHFYTPRLHVLNGAATHLDGTYIKSNILHSPTVLKSHPPFEYTARNIMLLGLPTFHTVFVYIRHNVISVYGDLAHIFTSLDAAIMLGDFF